MSDKQVPTKMSSEDRIDGFFNDIIELRTEAKSSGGWNSKRYKELQSHVNSVQQSLQEAISQSN